MIRPARTDEFGILTRISFASKGYWNYPQEYFDLWQRELTIDTDYIQENDVFVFESRGKVVAYYSMIHLAKDMEISEIRLAKGFWLEHMFIEPAHIGQGIGTKMFEHVRRRCKVLGIRLLRILSDPNSRGFYEKMGCEFLMEFPSNIPNRTTPYFLLRI